MSDAVWGLFYKLFVGGKGDLVPYPGVPGCAQDVTVI